MLGKGLESLIPQKGNGDAPAQHHSQTSGAGQGGGVPNNAGDAGMPSVPNAPQSQPACQEPARSEPIHEDVLAEVKPEPPRSEPVSAAPAAPAAVAAKVFQSQKQDTKRDGKETPPEADSIFHIETDRIKPNPTQPRRNFDEAGLRDLAHSIREFGFLQPLVVSRVEKETPDGIGIEYQLIAGERRLMAAKMLGLATVPAIVRNVDLEREKLELAVLENIQREDLNPIETARAFQRLQEEFRMTQREIAAKLGKSREVVANAVRLLDLPEYIQTAVEKGELSESHARLLIAIEDPAAQQHLFEDIVQNHLTTREVRERVGQRGRARGPRRGRPPKSAEAPLPPELKAMQETLSADLGAPVEIHKGAANGRITITFFSQEELENILRRLGSGS